MDNFYVYSQFSQEPVVDEEYGLHHDVSIDDLIDDWAVFADADCNRKHETHVDNFFLYLVAFLLLYML